VYITTRFRENRQPSRLAVSGPVTPLFGARYCHQSLIAASAHLSASCSACTHCCRPPPTFCLNRRCNRDSYATTVSWVDTLAPTGQRDKNVGFARHFRAMIGSVSIWGICSFPRCLVVGDSEAKGGRCWRFSRSYHIANMA